MSSSAGKSPQFMSLVIDPEKTFEVTDVTASRITVESVALDPHVFIPAQSPSYAVLAYPNQMAHERALSHQRERALYQQLMSAQAAQHRPDFFEPFPIPLRKQPAAYSSSEGPVVPPLRVEFSDMETAMARQFSCPAPVHPYSRSFDFSVLPVAAPVEYGYGSLAIDAGVSLYPTVPFGGWSGHYQVRPCLHVPGSFHLCPHGSPDSVVETWGPARQFPDRSQSQFAAPAISDMPRHPSNATILYRPMQNQSQKRRAEWHPAGEPVSKWPF
ncbi:MAG: hypothetical protein EBX40_06665 [Gammaproteobacteria bacterium]|nr:hypothetical protein [Gammaproteobacteria bacterium]